MSSESNTGIDLLQVRIETLSSKMDRLITIQEKVLSRLDGMSQDIDGIERDVETLKVEKEEIHFPPVIRKGPGHEMKEMCQEINSIMLAVNQRSEQQTQKLEGMERLVMSIQQVVSFIGETVKTSKIMDVIFKGPAAQKNKTISASRSKDCKSKLITKSEASENGEPVTSKVKDRKCKEGTFSLNLKGLKAQKKKKPPDCTDAVTLRKQALLFEEVQKLNQENAERSKASHHPEAVVQKSEEGVLTPMQQDHILDEDKTPPTEQEIYLEEENVETMEPNEEEKKETEPTLVEVQDEAQQLVEDEMSPKTTDMLKEQEVKDIEDLTAVEVLLESEITDTQPPFPHEDTLQSCLSHESEQVDEVTTSSKRRVTDEDLGLEDHKKSRVEGGQNEVEQEPEEPEDLRGIFKAEGVDIEFDFNKIKKEGDKDDNEDEENDNFFIDCTPPPPAPFNHRIVSAKPNQINNFYTINRQEVLGGGRFGQVHKCIENSSGLTLAAKIIKARSQKEKEVVKIEIQVMNQLDHANLIQLYAAYESRNDIILVLEYVDGGELFDRIIDENYKLTELDTVMFIRQICEGLSYMHKMYILHLDLKPENILCVSRLTNKIKIIDFGLARKYQPKEKLRVNFGTPEFLAPEVVNYDVVSFKTDMWSLGVITYMLLSGLSPFLGDDNNGTLNNILACQWNFEEDEFIDISKEAKDFISKMLIVDKSWRIGAGEALNHPWLSDPAVHFHLHEKKNMCRSRRNSCVPPPES
ncbi:myosin light chain kinase 3 [Triplophysa dalaica]|uniref:myosin light chain kinase 3 n=1 Tax=Triplophysa dalaica TaxID=1582913 RepID=UPI0024DF819D|nr:myosin light chain kinase 3 [Triplophysa dalaica]